MYFVKNKFLFAKVGFLLILPNKKTIIFGIFGHVQGISYICEKFRNEKFRNMKNPFRYGTVFDGEPSPRPDDSYQHRL